MGPADQVRLRIDHGGASPRYVDLETLPAVIGRDPDSDVVLDDELVSRHHLEIDRDAAGRLVVRDLGSSNGTHVDGARLAGPLLLTPAMGIRVGRTFLSLDAPAEPPLGVAAAEARGTSPTIVAAPPPREPALPPPAPVAASVREPAARAEGRRTSPALLGAAAAVVVFVVGGAVALAGGLFGRPATSPSPSSGGPSGGVARASDAPASHEMTSGSPMTMPSGPVGSPAAAPSGGGTAMKFAITIGSVSVTSDTTVTPTVCSRPAGKPHGLDVSYASSAGSSARLLLTIADTSASPVAASSADVSIGFTGLDKPFTASASDITTLAVDDGGDHATVTLAMKNAGGDSLSGTVTCAAIDG